MAQSASFCGRKSLRTVPAYSLASQRCELAAEAPCVVLGSATVFHRRMGDARVRVPQSGLVREYDWLRILLDDVTVGCKAARQEFRGS
jgi:hypothetical protein